MRVSNFSKLLGFAVICASLQAFGAQRGTTFHTVDPKGVFAPGLEGSPATRIELTSIGSGIQAGMKIGIRGVGGFADAEDPPERGTEDNSVTALYGVFVDSSGGFLQYGPDSHVQPVGMVNGDFNTRTCGSDPCILEVPTGAVALLFSPNDTYVDDNSDENGDYGVQITFPILSYNIYQVIKNPILNSPCTIVDLVAGKNADVVVELGPNIDVSNSEIIFEGPGGTSDPFEPDESQTDSSGKVIFNIDTVPQTIGINTMRITLKGSDDEEIATKNVQVKIHRTKAIKLGYIWLVSPNNKFSSPGLIDTTTTVTQGTAFTELLYPVAGIDFDWYLDLPVDSVELQGNMSEDITVLRRTLKDGERRFSRIGVTHVVGLVSNEYFDTFHGQLNRRGAAPFGGKSLLVAAGMKQTVAHELGHIFCIRYDAQPGCIGIDPVNGSHNPSGESNLSGYANDNYVTLGISRGPVKDQKSVMYSARPNVISGYWFSENEYLTLLRNNMQTQTSRKFASATEFSSLYVAENIKPNGQLKRVATYMQTATDDLIFQNGEYLVYAKNLNEDVIGEYRFDSGAIAIDEGQEQMLEISVPVNAETIFVEIYRDNASARMQLLDRIVVPVDLIQDKVQFVPKQAVKGSFGQFKGTLNAYLDEYRSYIEGKNVDFAKDVVSRKIINLVNQNLIDDFAQSSVLNVGANKMNELAVESLVKLESLENNPGDINAFVKISMNESAGVNSRNELRVDILRVPSSEYLLINEVFFDGFKINTKSFPGYSTAQSFLLISGEHSWYVKTYIASRRLWNGLQSGINSWVSEEGRLWLMLESEYDIDKKILIQKRISQLQHRINSAKNEQRNLLIKAAADVALNFVTP